MGVTQGNTRARRINLCFPPAERLCAWAHVLAVDGWPGWGRVRLQFLLTIKQKTRAVGTVAVFWAKVMAAFFRPGRISHLGQRRRF